MIYDKFEVYRAQESQQDKRLWREFFNKFNLSEYQQEQFHKYAYLLKAGNDVHNLTTLTELKSIIRYHFEDSLALCKAVSCSKIKSIADVGTGGGFPGIPLKIVYPELNVTLIEVNNKKIDFLYTVISELKLDSIFISETDWRTFLRKTEYDIDIFCARASLHPDELLRALKPGSFYKDAQIVYWASVNWNPTDKEKVLIKKEYTYKTGAKTRRLIFFAR